MTVLCFVVLRLESVSRTFKDIFEGKWSMLQEKLDTEHGLLDELETNKVITSQHRTAVEVMFVTVHSCDTTERCIV